MKTLYLDCSMGAAGDMLTAALLELIPDRDEFMAGLNTIGIPEVEISEKPAVKCGISGTQITVTIHGEEENEYMHNDHHGDSHGCTHNTHGHHHQHTHEHGELGHEHTGHGHEHNGPEHSEHGHHHSSLRNIRQLVENLKVSEKVKHDILTVYGLIAEAESKAHGVPIEEIHFHEVGTMDAVADIAAVCLLMEKIAPEQVITSPIHVGCGQVRCAHGILPVPAPATAYILRGIPIYSGKIKGELCTPTGAALIKHFTDHFGNMPVMRTQSIGYGMGKKDFEAANCVRALLGDTEGADDIVVELSCNIDDMTAEAIGYAMEALFAAGALEVYTVPIGMKKSRPGILLSVMCRESQKDAMVHLLFKHTTTLGVRQGISARYTLTRSVETVQTRYGEVRKKVSGGYGVKRQKYEYDDISAIARKNDIAISDVLSSLMAE